MTFPTRLSFGQHTKKGSKCQDAEMKILRWTRPQQGAVLGRPIQERGQFSCNCKRLHCNAVHRGTVQFIAMRCTAMQRFKRNEFRCTALQRLALLCRAMQSVAKTWHCIAMLRCSTGHWQGRWTCTCTCTTTSWTRSRRFSRTCRRVGFWSSPCSLYNSLQSGPSSNTSCWAGCSNLCSSVKLLSCASKTSSIHPTGSRDCWPCSAAKGYNPCLQVQRRSEIERTVYGDWCFSGDCKRHSVYSCKGK